jgi:hypothetical protein
MTGVYLIALAIVVTVALAALLFIVNTRRHAAGIKAQMRSALYELTQKNQLDINHKDEHPNMIIAVDELKMALLFIKYRNDTVYNEVISLAHVTACNLKGAGNGTRSSAENSEVYLSFRFLDNTTTDLLMYKEAEDGMFEKLKLTELAGKWQAYVKKALIRELK